MSGKCVENVFLIFIYFFCVCVLRKTHINFLAASKVSFFGMLKRKGKRRRKKKYRIVKKETIKRMCLTP